MEKRILKIVSDHFGISEEEMKGESRNADIVQARHYAMLMLRDAGLSYNKIGNMLNKGHDTVIYAVNRIQSNVDIYTIHREICNEIKKKINWDGLPEDIFMENDCYGIEPEKKFVHPFAHLVSRSTHYQTYIR